MRGLFSVTTFFRLSITGNGEFRNHIRHSSTSRHDSLAVSANSALLAAKSARCKTSEKADKVISFFTDLGFSKSQLSRLVRANPQLLLYPNPPKIFKPKIDFFLSKGISSAHLVRVLSVYPHILIRSLKNVIIPHFNYFKNLFGSHDAVVHAFKLYPDILAHKPQSYVEPNMTVLRQVGVPETRITYFLSQNPRVLITTPGKFRAVVEEVIRMGCDPLKLSFVMAINAKITISKSTWEKKVDVYKKCGLSDKDILQAFLKFPVLMKVSEDKINSAMDVFVNKLGWDSSMIVKFPAIMGYSLRKRIVPRSEVIQVLLSKGLINKSVVMYSFLVLSEDVFLKKFVVNYEQEVPELLKLYQKHMGVSSDSK